MSRTTSANFTTHQFTWATTAADAFKKEDVELLAQAVEDHDHTSGKGVAVMRIGNGCATGATVINGSGTLTLPTTTDTIVGRATTDTLTNKTVTAPIVSGHVTRAGSSPSLSMQSAAGSSPPSPVLSGTSTDFAGGCTFGTGTSVGTGNLIQISFAATQTNACFVMVMPVNAATQALGLYVTSQDTSKFIVACTVAPSSGQTNSSYGFHWIAVG